LQIRYDAFSRATAETGSFMPKNEIVLITAMISAFDAALHRCMGRDTPARLRHAFANTDRPDLDMPLLRKLQKSLAVH
jgi:ABC-type phosphate/phosphonate transport system substrate-binding protein